AHRDMVNSLSFSPDSSLLASGGYREVKIWRRVRNSQKLNIASAAGGTVGAIACTPDGKYLATGGADGLIKLWDGAAGKPIADLAGHTALISSLRFSADGSRLCSGSTDRTVRVWDVANHCQIAKADAPGDVLAVTWVGTGGQIASAGADRSIRIW